MRNLRPRPGEPAVFPEVWREDQSALVEDHALITRLHGLHGRGEITVLAASSTDGTWAAVEYMTQPSHAKELVARVAVAGKLPETYQLVVRAKFKDQVPSGPPTSPTVCWRAASPGNAAHRAAA